MLNNRQFSSASHRQYRPQYQVHETDSGHALTDVTNNKVVKTTSRPMSIMTMHHGMDMKKYRADVDAYYSKVAELHDMAKRWNNDPMDKRDRYLGRGK